MKRSSATCALLIISSLLAGSSWSGPIVRQSGVVHPGTGSLRAAPAAAHARDTWLMVALAGGLLALHLRRTHRGVRLGAHAAWHAAAQHRARR